MRKTFTRVTLFLTTLAASGVLFATMDTQKEFVAKYPDAKAKLGKCSTCHVKALPKKADTELNAYGRDAMHTVADPKAAKKVYDYGKIEGLDSDGDGVKNLEEIKAGTNPGVPAQQK